MFTFNKLVTLVMLCGAVLAAPAPNAADSVVKRQGSTLDPAATGTDPVSSLLGTVTSIVGGLLPIGGGSGAAAGGTGAAAGAAGPSRRQTITDITGVSDAATTAVDDALTGAELAAGGLLRRQSSVQSIGDTVVGAAGSIVTGLGGLLSPPPPPPADPDADSD